MEKYNKILAKLIEKYYLIIKKRNIMIRECSLFPFHYDYIDLSTLKITPKGEMYLKWQIENPDKTFDDFNEFYEKGFSKQI